MTNYRTHTNLEDNMQDEADFLHSIVNPMSIVQGKIDKIERLLRDMDPSDLQKSLVVEVEKAKRAIERMVDLTTQRRDHISGP